MPLYKIERAEKGTFYKEYTVSAADADDAMEQIWNEEVEPDSEYFDQSDCDQVVTQLDTEYAVDQLDADTLEDLGL